MISFLQRITELIEQASNGEKIRVALEVGSKPSEIKAPVSETAPKLQGNFGSSKSASTALPIRPQ